MEKNRKKQGFMQLVTVKGHTLGGQQMTDLYYWSENSTKRNVHSKVILKINKKCERVWIMIIRCIVRRIPLK